MFTINSLLSMPCRTEALTKMLPEIISYSLERAKSFAHSCTQLIITFFFRIWHLGFMTQLGLVSPSTL